MFVNSNPGEELRSLLKEIFPQHTQKEQSEELESFLTRIDEGLIANGGFVSVVYESSINYVLRRLINTGEYLKRKYETDEFPAERFIEELRFFIKENTRIPYEYSDFCILCLRERY